MIYIKRSTDFHKDSVWVVGNFDEKKMQTRQLYLGPDVNDAIAAAVIGGMGYAAAAEAARAEITRSKRAQVNDEIAELPAFALAGK